MASESRDGKPIYALPHFHFDFEWWKTLEGYAEDVNEVLRGALDMLDEHPGFCYTLDCYYALRSILDTPDEERFRRHLEAGRIEIVGNTLTAPDENLPTGEALVRHFLLGRRRFRERFGVTARVGWMIDEFGHTLQLPQILAKSGMTAVGFARGIPVDSGHPTDFVWEAPDGSRVLAHWMATHYSGFFTLHALRSLRMARYRQEVALNLDLQGRLSPAGMVMQTMGSDFTPPRRDWVEFVEEWNRKADGKQRMKFSLPSDYFSALPRERLPVVRGEFNPLFEGCYESREGLKKQMREAQSRILEAETWCSLASLLGGRYPDFTPAWEEIVVNDAHDVGCGTILDRLVVRAEARYRRAREFYEEAERRALQVLGRLVDTSGSGRPVLVFNSLPWPRRGVARVAAPAGPSRVVDEKGAELPSQVSGEEINFLVEVPPLGYRCIFLVPGSARHGAGEFHYDTHYIENHHLRVRFSPEGDIGGILDKATGRDIPLPQGNHLVAQEDIGNLWVVKPTGRIHPPGRVRSIRIVEDGPVRVTLEVVRDHPVMTTRTRTSLVAGDPAVHVETEVDFHGRESRVVARFQVPRGGGRAVHEVPYGALERPDGHWPVQNWVDLPLEGNPGGLAIFNRGIPSVEIRGSVVSLGLLRSVAVWGPGLLLHSLTHAPSNWRTLLRGVTLFQKGFEAVEGVIMPIHHLVLREFASNGGGGVKPGTSVPDHLIPYLQFWKRFTALEHGKHTFEYMLHPHPGTWREAHLPRLGWEYQRPLRVLPVETHPGELPKSFSFGSVDTPGAPLLCLKRAEDGRGVVARLYEAEGEARRVRLQLFRGPQRAEKVSLHEEETYGPVSLPEVPLGPWEIAGLRLVF
ncbi:MAG: hypothetical protein HY558_03895 [Euryarchaeota archaeon]|nr:hypothetical protein [Euryarchaeota archaeon]